MNNIFHKSILNPNNNKNHFGVKVSIGILIFSPEMVSVSANRTIFVFRKYHDCHIQYLIYLLLHSYFSS